MMYDQLLRETADRGIIIFTLLELGRENDSCNVTVCASIEQV